ncbi:MULTISPECIES: acetyl-CoA C-acyltransferase [unclassified Sphingomonas]|jgi:acetyl-CoA C-acetyltransferase|uniref:acetyl-CoA C-acyltransferase n=1 Tax=unclassified Sphingomonas TaxID=196159 RepID=UPI00095C3C58|nr:MULTISPECIES: acetyl-CoA C-acyltransferase [unclassified Sphingomonas]MBN8812617.1 acetyl-CoA C-acyltransferase [Sphingomonas sp.]OJY53586.1 MAG: acetyl-CoA acetyltransferase [Sphingomonas sp. 67-41]HCW61510.1 acetyl-CoA C-acetyltransferase [Sphingobium sp.]|tara:strand:+ start:21762 stop:22946 length:1185 start_codon:yes stop_codon:yes gene_type:complete
MSFDPVIIASVARTPMAGFQGAFAPMTAVELGSAAIRSAVERAGIGSEAVERIYMGCVLPAAQGQAPARQAALGAGLARSVEATTVNKMCGSGMQATIMACEAILSGSIDIAVAGGMESMTNAPYALPKHRGGARIGHDRVVDTMMMDGLEDAYARGKPMGAFAEDSAREYQFSREEQDAYALASLSRANAAIAGGVFAAEIVPVEVSTRGSATTVAVDEQPGKARPDKIPLLKPAFVDGGTVTAANSSSISDGAAALVLVRESVAQSRDFPIEARIMGMAAHAQEPALFTTAPVPAIRKLLAKTGWTIEDVDLFEINEAFAVVAMIAMRDLGIPHEKLNVNGGATALGHPIGASGARIIVTLVSALKARGLKRGVAALCIGGGEATAVAVEIA